MSRRVLFLAVALVGAALLALCLQGAVQAAVAGPLVRVAWVIGLFVRSLPGAVCWSGVIVLVATLALSSLLTRLRSGAQAGRQPAPPPGPVEKTARQIRNTGRGPYFQWLVARQLAEMAHHILTGRSAAPAGSRPALRGYDWQPPAEVQSYLEAGLERFPIRYSRRRLFFRRPPAPPFDADLEQVIAYLESQVETKT